MYENITCTYFIFARFDMKSVYHPTIILLKISKNSLIETIQKNELSVVLFDMILYFLDLFLVIYMLFPLTYDQEIQRTFEIYGS